MKHKVRVIGIARGSDGVLLLKKKTFGTGVGVADGSEEWERGGIREGREVFWELPAGKIEFGEQPEEAMGRILFEQIGIRLKDIRLKDVICFVGLYGEKETASLYIIYDINFNRKTKIRLGNEYSAYKFMHGEDFERYLVGDASKIVLGLVNEKTESKMAAQFLEQRQAMNGATVFVDGCSKGNPGPSGIGYYIVGEDGEVLEKGGEFVGMATSRVAEYLALKEGITRAKALGLKRVRFVGDSLMMINQMNRIYKVKNQDIAPIYRDVRNLLADGFEAVAFWHVKREKNFEADREANLAVERQLSGEDWVESGLKKGSMI